MTSYLVRLEFVSQDVDKGARLARVKTQEGYKQLSLLQLTLKGLKKNIQDPIGIQTESTW